MSLPSLPMLNVKMEVCHSERFGAHESWCVSGTVTFNVEEYWVEDMMEDAIERKVHVLMSPIGEDRDMVQQKAECWGRLKQIANDSHWQTLAALPPHIPSGSSPHPRPRKAVNTPNQFTDASKEAPPRNTVIIVETKTGERCQVEVRDGFAFKWEYKSTDTRFCAESDIAKWRGCGGFDF